MSRSLGRQVGSRLAIELLLLLVLVAAFFTVYIVRFHEPPQALWAHLGLLSSAWVGLVGLRLLVWNLAPTARAVKWISVVLLVGSLSAMLVYYALVLIGLHSWGRVISWRLISTYAFQMGAMLSAMDISPIFVAVASVAAGATLVVLLWISARMEWLGLLRLRLSASMSWMLAIFGLCVFAIRLYVFVAVPPVETREPISLTFFPELGVKAVQSHTFHGTVPLNQEQETARSAFKVSVDANLASVILIVGDALRRDHMGIYGYSRETTPNLNALVQQGRVAKAERMASVCTESSCGLFALVNSKYVHQFSDRAFGLPEILRRHGYEIHMILGGDHTNFYGLRELYGDVNSYYDGASAHGYYMNDDQLVIDKIKAMPPSNGNPIFLQIHLMSAHPLGRRQQRFLKYLPSENYATVLLQSGGPNFKRTNFYDNGVLQLDDTVQQISAVLAEKGYLRRAVVVLTGDHGEMLGEHQEFSHAKSVYQPALDIPFVMVGYGDLSTTPFAHHAFASQVDIAPTILRALKISSPSVWSGAALQDRVTRDFIFFQQGAQVGLLDVRDPETVFKYWKNLDAGTEFAFDLIGDGEEQTNIAETIAPAKLNEWRLHSIEPAAAVIDKRPD